MEIARREERGVTVLELVGVVELGRSAETLAKKLEEELGNGPHHVVLDFAGINYMDSTGIGELVGYLERFREKNRHLAIARPTLRIVRLLQAVKLDSVFRIYDSLDEAISAESVMK